MSIDNDINQGTKWYQRLDWVAKETDTKRSSLATAAGVQRSNVTNWLAGASETIDAAKLIAMCDLIGASVRWVATGKGEPFARAEGANDLPCLNGPSTFSYASDEDLANWVVENERSFEPRIKEGDYLFIDTAKKELVSPHLYVFRDRDTGQIILRRYYRNLLTKAVGLLDGLADERRPESFALFPAKELEKILQSFEVIGQVSACYTTRI